MRYRLFFSSALLVILMLFLIFNPIPGNALNATCCDAEWKLPLPSGNWIITQGDQDSCVSSHCYTATQKWQINLYALDIVSASENNIKTLGAQVLAPADGIVWDELWDGYGGGKVLKVEHGKGGPVTIYLHLSKYLVGKDAVVKQGDPIAEIGNSTTEGNSIGAHLHLVVFKSKTNATGLKITSWDGNTDFSTKSIIKSTNRSGLPPVTETLLPPSALERPSLSQPDNSSTSSQNTEIMLTWNSSANASQYRVEVWGEPYGSMTPCDWQSDTSCRIGTMYPGTFSWHVRARNSAGQESDWSDTWTFSIQGPVQAASPTQSNTNTPQPQSPGVPSLHDPANGASYPQSHDLSFAWNYISNSEKYYLEYWGGPYGTLNSGWINDVTYHVGTMWPGTYSWHVKALGPSGKESSWSETWTFTIAQPVNTSLPSTEIPPTAVPTATPVPQLGFLILVDDLSIRTESGMWPPSSGQKIIGHIKIKNGGDLTLHIEHIGVRGRRNNSESWDIGFWTIDVIGHDTWSLDPNNERSLIPGYYSFRISYSLDGTTWTEIGNEINFTVP